MARLEQETGSQTGARDRWLDWGRRQVARLEQEKVARLEQETGGQTVIRDRWPDCNKRQVARLGAGDR